MKRLSTTFLQDFALESDVRGQEIEDKKWKKRDLRKTIPDLYAKIAEKRFCLSDTPREITALFASARSMWT